MAQGKRAGEKSDFQSLSGFSGQTASASIATEFHPIPISFPFFTPRKSATAPQTDLFRKIFFRDALSGSSHN
jgi:hypothetical protein